MSATETETQYFETLSGSEWAEVGGGGSAARGLYIDVLKQVLGTGRRYFHIPLDRGPFAGKKSASVATALKNAKDKNPTVAGISDLKISGRQANPEKGVTAAVFIENPNGSDDDE